MKRLFDVIALVTSKETAAKTADTLHHKTTYTHGLYWLGVAAGEWLYAQHYPMCPSCGYFLAGDTDHTECQKLSNSFRDLCRKAAARRQNDPPRSWELDEPWAEKGYGIPR